MGSPRHPTPAHTADPNPTESVVERSNAVNSKLQHRQEHIEELNQVRTLLHKLQVPRQAVGAALAGRRLGALATVYMGAR